MNKYKYIGVRLGQDANAHIRDISDRRGIPVAVMIRSIVMEWLEKEDIPAVEDVTDTAEE